MSESRGRNDGKFWMPGAVLLLLTGLLMNWGCTPAEKEALDMTEPPHAEKIPKELTIHGDTRVDEYFWLNQREDP